MFDGRTVVLNGSLIRCKARLKVLHETSVTLIQLAVFVLPLIEGHTGNIEDTLVRPHVVKVRDGNGCIFETIH